MHSFTFININIKYKTAFIYILSNVNFKLNLKQNNKDLSYLYVRINVVYFSDITFYWVNYPSGVLRSVNGTIFTERAFKIN